MMVLLPIYRDGAWRHPVPRRGGGWACPLCSAPMREADCFGWLQVDCDPCQVRDLISDQRHVWLTEAGKAA